MQFDLILRNIDSSDIEDVVRKLTADKPCPNVAEGNVPVVETGVFNAACRQNTYTPEVLPTFGGPVLSNPSEFETVSTEDVTGKMDAEGLVWDERIHSSNKKMTAKGIWTRRRGVSDTEYETVKTQLRGGTFNAPMPPMPPVAAPMPPMPPMAAPMPPMPPMAAVEEIPAFLRRTPVSAVTLNDVIAKVSTGLAQSKLAPTDIPEIVKQVNQNFNVQASSLVDFAARPDILQAVMDVLTQRGV